MFCFVFLDYLLFVLLFILKEELETYLMTPISHVNSPTFFLFLHNYYCIVNMNSSP